jgi:hypothetical protein
MTRLAALAIALASPLAGCADIEAWGFEVCGNNLVEPDADEDCDLIVDPALGEDLQCGPPDGTPAQCRYVCDGAECPQGWTCGDDGLCRPPSGEFEVDDEPRIVVAARAIALRNVLGEDESELIARLDGDIVVFGSDPDDFRPGAQLSIAAARGELAFADVDDDERFDILAPAAAVELDASAAPRVHVLRDDGDRLATAVVPQRAGASLFAAVVGVRIADSGAEVLVQVLRDDEVGALVARVDPSNCVTAPADASVSLGADPDAIVPVPAAIYGDGTAIVAIATVGSPTVSIVELQRECGPDVCAPAHAVGEPCATHLQPRASVTMPAAVATPGCLFVDVDGAFDLDLLCHLDGDAFGVALHDGTSLAVAEPGDTWLGGLDALPASQSRDCAPIARVLAAADLDGDGDTDLVTPHGVFRREPTGVYARSHARTLGDGWGEAVIGDFDRDDQRDVLVSLLQLADGCAPGRLQALEQTDGAFAARSVREAALPSQLRVGDFDGDGIDDVAVAEPRGDEVWATVLFGDVERALEDTVSVGGFADITALTAVRGREGAEINEDLIGDLAIVSEDGEFLTLVTGTTTRAPLSPLELAADTDDGNAPVVVLAGALVARDPAEPQGDITPDVLTLRGESAWLFRDEDVHHGDEPIVWSEDPFGIRVACSTWAVAPNLGEGGTALAGIDGHAARIAGTEHGCDLAATPQLVVARYAGTRDEPELLTAHGPAPGALRRPAVLAWLDLDGSGALDLLVHFEYDGELRRGTLAWAVDPTASSAPQLVPLLAELDVWAATPIDADADPDLEIAILGADGLRILDHDGDPGEPAIVVRDPVFDPPRVPIGDELVRLVAGDVDGDEIADLALLVSDAIYIYPALERQ